MDYFVLFPGSDKFVDGVAAEYILMSNYSVKGSLTKSWCRCVSLRWQVLFLLLSQYPLLLLILFQLLLLDLALLQQLLFLLLYRSLFLEQYVLLPLVLLLIARWWRVYLLNNWFRKRLRSILRSMLRSLLRSILSLLRSILILLRSRLLLAICWERSWCWWLWLLWCRRLIINCRSGTLYLMLMLELIKCWKVLLLLVGGNRHR